MQLTCGASHSSSFVTVCCGVVVLHSGQAVLVDVRLGGKYEASHAAASLSLPLYLPIQNWDLASIIRRAGWWWRGGTAAAVLAALYI